MADKNATIKFLKGKVAVFIKERDWEQYHNPKNLSMSISIEAAELMEIFQWKGVEERPDQKSVEKIKEELSDILIYSLSLANALDIDVSEAMLAKLAKNAEKYPVEKVRGRADKYTTYEEADNNGENKRL